MFGVFPAFSSSKVLGEQLELVCPVRHSEMKKQQVPCLWATENKVSKESDDRTAKNEAVINTAGHFHLAELLSLQVVIKAI